MDLLKKFNEFIRQNALIQPGNSLLLAVSGGVDSVVLCELCRISGFNIAIAHCNFQLRGKESDNDKEFVEGLAKKYDIPFFVKDFDTKDYAEKNKLSIQEAARELRYSWFNELTSERNTDYQLSTIDYRLLLTAHHADDNIETILMNFFKGTGIAGLRGILPKQGNIVRPLLFARKEDIVFFAKENKLQWVEDSSNLSDKYSRNFFRNQLIPLVVKLFPAAMDNLADNISRFRDIEIAYHQAISFHKKKLLEQKGNEWHIPVLKLKKSEPLQTIIFEITRSFGFSSLQVPDIMNLLDSDTGKYVASATHRIIRHRKWLVIAPIAEKESQTVLIEKEEAKIHTVDFDLLLSNAKTSGPGPGSNAIACLDAALVKFPLILRKWKQGDYFYPLGMKKKKKVARFLIDQKLSKTEKEKIWVIEMDKKIVWVVGRRIDDRFKVTGKTKEVLKIELVDPTKSSG